MIVAKVAHGRQRPPSTLPIKLELSRKVAEISWQSIDSRALKRGV
jgi:hypothetical protein